VLGSEPSLTTNFRSTPEYFSSLGLLKEKLKSVVGAPPLRTRLNWSFIEDIFALLSSDVLKTLSPLA
jgi:hypothetical protein